MKASKNIQFAFMGDIMLGGEFLTFAERHGIDILAPFKLIDPYLREADIVFGNLEGPIFQGSERREGVTTLLSNHPSLLNYLKQLRLCVMNLGNNHIMDYAPEGIYETMSYLNRKGIYMIGAGKDSDEAERELTVEINGMSVGFLSYTSDEDHIRSVIASMDKPGCASFLNTEKVVKKVRELKKSVDLVCVSMHWGDEYFSYPNPKQVKIARSLVDAGATYIIGHHPHVIQGIERYNGGLIMYSLGNLFFPDVRTISGRFQWRKPITREFVVVKSKADETGTMSTELVGGRVDQDHVITPIEIESQRYFAAKVSKLSAPIMARGYDLFWEKYERKRRGELERESLVEAFKKMLLTPKRDLIRSLSAEDIWRNLRRIRSIIVKGN